MNGPFISAIAKPMGWVLEQMYNLIGDYGLTIVAFTVIVKLCLYPLYAKQIKSTANMSKIQPKMKELQTKYADDKEMLNQKLSELYKQEHYNPMSGCLPLIIQMPIIFGLFALLRNPIAFMKSDTMLMAIHESFLWLPDLTQPDKWILPIGAAIVTYLSFSMNQAMNPQMMGGGMPGMGDSMSGMTKVMQYFFPVMILWMGRTFPGGLTVYWFFGQVIQVLFNLHLNNVRKKIRLEAEKEEIRRTRKI